MGVAGSECWNLYNNGACIWDTVIRIFTTQAAGDTVIMCGNKTINFAEYHQEIAVIARVPF